jgi:flagellar biosynthesis/type III secretory pathway protein FliH
MVFRKKGNQFYDGLFSLEESRNQGIQESRNQGIHESRNQGIKESRNQGIQESRNPGIQESSKILINIKKYIYYFMCYATL